MICLFLVKDGTVDRCTHGRLSSYIVDTADWWCLKDLYTFQVDKGARFVSTWSFLSNYHDTKIRKLSLLHWQENTTKRDFCIKRQCSTKSNTNLPLRVLNCQTLRHEGKRSYNVRIVCAPYHNNVNWQYDEIQLPWGKIFNRVSWFAEYKGPFFILSTITISRLISGISWYYSYFCK